VSCPPSVLAFDLPGISCSDVLIIIRPAVPIAKFKCQGEPTVPFRPSVHDFRIFGLRESRKIIFQIKANFETVSFFGRDA
jgi:hypothetical protein